MKLAPAPANDEQAKADVVNPFVNAFANVGAILGRDIGVIALRSIENQKGNHGAICFWMNGRIPDSVLAKVPEEHRAGLYALMLAPVGSEIPPFIFDGIEVRVAETTIADGSKLFAFLRVHPE